VQSTAPATEKKAPDLQMFTSEDLLREVKAQMIEHYAINSDLVLELARPWGAVKVPVSGVELKVVEYPRDGLSSLLNIRCKMISGEQLIGEWAITLRANLWKEVWVASSRLDRGQSLTESMVTAQKVDILQNRNALLDAGEKPTTYEMAQNVNAGVALMKRDVIEKPVIRKNQIVDAVINKGALSISTKAQALENGAPNALVRMRNLDSSKEFSAQVVNETQVNVLF
jgi:flagella basal body P-ring formation protein FlgA